MLNDINVQYLKGVGPKRVEKLNKLGIFTIDDLLEYYPRKYEDRRKTRKISDVTDGEKVLLKVKIVNYPSIFKPKRKLSILKVDAKDETGFVLITWFNKDYLKDKIKINEYYNIFGKIKISYGKIEIINPDIELANDMTIAGKIMPIYPLTYNLTNNELIKIINNAIKFHKHDIINVIPESIINKYSLLNKREAVEFIHFPLDRITYLKAKKTLAFEKLLILQLGLLTIKSRLSNNMDGISFSDKGLSEEFIKNLPFTLTNAQIKVIKEIKKDMTNSKPMNRLIQGDVGSGKTIVAVVAMLNAVSSGYQTAMMAPTEILAMQHYKTITSYTNELGLKVEFLSGSTKQNKRKEILENLKSGLINILIGTHAIIEKDVIFKNIGVVVTDEQHRFGVRQRALLSSKGLNPDILVMTATPIPRTLALMFYGDLDISIIDELPPGRQVIKTYSVGESKKEDVFKFVKDRICEGRQAYIVAPLIEESDKMELDSAVEIYEKLSKSYFNEYNIDLLHGKMKNNEKEEVMKKFYNGITDILVSTTVIEVGVNVPNAVVMLILNSERFGLAQLHQLRGRVGRGRHQSYCILVNESKSKKSKERMNILTQTNNGFIISEKDLELRGPGEFFGTKQHGIPEYDISGIVSDVKVIQEVQMLSKQLLKCNPKLEGKEFEVLKTKIKNLFKNEEIAFN